VPKGTEPTDKDWADKGQTSQNGEPLTFDNLTPGEDYVVITRKPGDDNHKPSAPSNPTEVTTPKAEQNTSFRA
jgi:hypothetical protein